MPMANKLWMGIRKSTFEDTFKLISVGDGTTEYPNDHISWDPEHNQPNGNPNDPQCCVIMEESAGESYGMRFQDKSCDGDYAALCEIQGV